MSATLKLLPTAFDVEKLKLDVKEDESRLSLPEVYSNPSKSIELNRKIKRNLDIVNKVQDIDKKILDIDDFLNLCELENDENLYNDVVKELAQLEKEVSVLYLETLLNKPYDHQNAIIKIHSGAGGTESCDWVAMLYRMYKMYGEKKGGKVTLLDQVEGDGAGYKSIEFKIDGEDSYGYLKGEMGVHRLVRISPFDANKRRHTSFASVEVMPEITNDNTEVVIRPEDLKIDTYRSSGAGGQHVNTTDSAVRITHLPTGIVTACQTERSQVQNKENALSMLKSRLVMLQLETKKKSIDELKGDVKKIEWGSQIRSYVFCPYTLVKDNRTGQETSDLQSVMNGELDDFVFAYLKQEGNKDNGNN